MSGEDNRRSRPSTGELQRRGELLLRGIKVCCRCRRELPVSEFAALHSAKDGYAPQCRGCQRAYYQQAKARSVFAASDFGAIRAAAVRRGIPFEVTAVALRRLWLNTPETCAYCGQGPDAVGEAAARIMERQEGNRFLSALAAKLRWAYKQKHPSRRLTIDRKDNEGAYTLENIQKACFICNFLKGAILTDEEMAFLAPRLWDRINAALAVPPASGLPETG